MSLLNDWIRLWHIPGVGPKTFNFILSRFADPSELFASNYEVLLKRGLTTRIANAIISNHSSSYLKDIAWMNSNPLNNIITITSSNYPQSLKEISCPPPILYVVGNSEILNDSSCIAIVGSRKATAGARDFTYNLSMQLSDLGITIVSGLARGIDAKAHQGAIATNNGKTAAILANGLDTIYPREHKSLAANLLSKGVLVSEFPPGTKPLPNHFPRRNRIISGLCAGTVIVEAADKSGTLITAKYAIEQGREVFAIPGPVNNPLNQGCHKLIQDGAKLTTCVKDIIIELQGMNDTQNLYRNVPVVSNQITSELGRLLGYIEYSPMSIEKIIEKSGLTPDQVSSMLIELEIGGRIIYDAYGQYSRSAADVK